MQVHKLAVPDAYELVPELFPDHRGVFFVPFKAVALAEVLGYWPAVAQVNQSVSTVGALRGPHYADVPPGQAKYAFCTRGALLDYIIDLRIGSPTFGQHATVRLDDRNRHAVYAAEGLGHAILALEPDTILTYVSSVPYDPAAEHAVHPLDPALGLHVPAGITPVLSEKDSTAPTLAQALAQNRLPRYEDCLTYYERLRAHREPPYR